MKRCKPQRIRSAGTTFTETNGLQRGAFELVQPVRMTDRHILLSLLALGSKRVLKVRVQELRIEEYSHNESTTKVLMSHVVSSSTKGFRSASRCCYMSFLRILAEQGYTRGDEVK